MTEMLVAIVSYKNPVQTTTCVESLLDQTVPTRPVVWDNYSDEETRRILKLHSKKLGYEVVFSDDNILWSPAINRILSGMTKNERYFGMSNNDVTYPKDAMRRIIEVLNDPLVGATGPTGSAIGGPQDFIANWGAWPDEAEGDFAKLQEVIRDWQPLRVPYLIGASMFFRRDTWERIGPLDETMPLGADDHDYCIRLKDVGYQIKINRNVYINHYGHASGDSPEWDQWGGPSWDSFNHKWEGYFKTEEEAIKSHWGGQYNEGWDRGTGWDAN